MASDIEKSGVEACNTCSDKLTFPVAKSEFKTMFIEWRVFAEEGWPCM